MQDGLIYALPPFTWLVGERCGHELQLTRQTPVTSLLTFPGLLLCTFILLILAGHFIMRIFYQGFFYCLFIRILTSVFDKVTLRQANRLSLAWSSGTVSVQTVELGIQFLIHQPEVIKSRSAVPRGVVLLIKQRHSPF